MTRRNDLNQLAAALEEFRSDYGHYPFVNWYHAKHAFDTGFIKSMPDMSKQWLFVEPDKNWSGNVIVNRTERYPNDTFNWKAIVAHYGSRIVFIGLPHEHEKFCASFGKVRYRPTVDMLEVARMIAGSALFIGNQSAAMTIAEGLKHPRIQESCLWLPDCIYPGAKNAQYVHNGACVLPVKPWPQLIGL